MSESAVTEQPTQYPPRDPAKPRRHRVNLALAGVLLAQGMSYEEIAPKVGSKNGNSLRVNLHKKGVNLKSTRNPSPEHLATASLTAKLVSEASGQIQDMLNEEIAAQIKSVRAMPMKYGELANVNQGRAGLVKQIAESFRAVNGNPDSITFQFGASRLSDARETPQAVVDCGSAVEVTPTPDTPPVQGA